MRLSTFSIIFALVASAAVAQDMPGREREPNVSHERMRQERALKRIQSQMTEQRAENKTARRVVADAEPASR